ncbi:MAG: virulence RhuM family protein [Opitutaceae bacterium]|nr:virulence RhuM family protein [Opitutaceae bacterium]
MNDPGEIILFQTEDGQTRIDVRLVGETVWLSAGQIADLFQRDKSTISRHIQNVFDEGELKPESVVALFATTAADGKTYQVDHYSLDVIISVGYRVKSHRGVQFRVWATQQLRDYLVKGFVLNDEKFKQGKASNYFEQLLARIRDIRSSEKEFWRKVLEIYATSIDYDPQVEASRKFFATIQNKMHWAAHGHTAAEVIRDRADSAQPNMGLTNWPKGQVHPRKADIAIAKNYLAPAEIEQLNLIVSLYLDFATLQATNRRPMYMRDWIAKLDQFLQLSEREILTHAGTVTAEAARALAEQEYDKYQRQLDAQPSPVEVHFDEAVKKAKQLRQPKKKSGKKTEGRK